MSRNKDEAPELQWQGRARAGNQPRCATAKRAREDEAEGREELAPDSQDDKMEDEEPQQPGEAAGEGGLGRAGQSAACIDGCGVESLVRRIIRGSRPG